MSSRSDLSRWNRAGLRRFTYVDGNAPLYLEQLREEFVRHFPGRWLELPPSPDADQEQDLLPERLQFERNRKFVAQYQGVRRDIAWELSRVFARACHVLTGHVDAHANEAFLRTATQWEHVRRLVATIDYQPAPAASAVAAIVITAKAGKSGTLPQGFQIKHTPPDGGPQVIFETFEDIEVDHELNELRHAGWDISEELLGEAGTSPAVATQYSTAAMYPVSNVQGVGPVRTSKLNTLAGAGGFRIKDFLELDPDNPGLPPQQSIPETWLREVRAKAIAIATFQLEPGWTEIVDWMLPQIAETDVATVMEVTGKNEGQVHDLQLRIELIGTYLDDPVYHQTRLADLITQSVSTAAESTETTFLAPRKPKVEPGQPAIIFHSGEQTGEAVWIADVTPIEQNDD